MADTVSRVADPAVVVTVSTAFVSVRASGSLPVGLAWGALAVLFCVGLPWVALSLMLRRGVVTDPHLLVREHRRQPLLVAAGSLVVGLVLLSATGAPRPVVAYLCGMLAGLAVMTVVTVTVSKASFHAAVAAGAGSTVAVELGADASRSAAVATTVAIGVVIALTALAVLLVGWARVRAGRHSTPQVLVGLLVGTAATLAVYLPLR
ncbi:phosphatase PAP2 family protein [Terracoccus luteus]|uniref:phosphatase PAP2 family protein n=1 Tax=Terracoccus luteus TaxID=53356 RepID=UPI000EB4A3E4|nr:phosphatase PAP2 family protein [Terracoccus luteus]